MRDHVAISFENFALLRAHAIVCVILAACLPGCSDRARLEPTETFAKRVEIDGSRPATVSNELQRGVYLVEAREQDVDVRVTVTAAGRSVTLEDLLPRHGAVYKVVSLEAAGPVRVDVTSVDHRSKRGGVALRILRWARDPQAAPGETELGYAAQSTANELTTAGNTESWTRAADKLHEAVTHFETAGDDAARGQAAYSLAYVQYGPRDQFAAAVRACEIAAEAFASADDEVGVQNAVTLRAASEIDLASSMSADTQRAEQKALFAEADRRLTATAAFFEKRGMGVRAEYAINMRAVRASTVGDYEAAAELLAKAVDMARANADERELALTLANLAAVHNFLGRVAQAAREYEALLPLVDREQQPFRTAVLLGNYGELLVDLGDFDRALALHLESLAIYTKLGEEDDRAIELSALGGLYLRTGDAQKAYDTLQTAIATQERLADNGGLLRTLRLAGNAASALGKHDAALEYLRRAARSDPDPHSVARTTVLIAGELRTVGDLDSAERTLAAPLASTNRLVLANALEERSMIRIARRQYPAAISDLHAADEQYAALGLEFDRIDTHTALSRALLATHDVEGATTAAEEAIAIVGRIRVTSANPEWRARFLSARYGPYEALIAAQLASATPGAEWRAFRTAEEVRARSLSDELAVGADAILRTVTPEESALRAQLTSLQVRLESDQEHQGADDSATQSLRRSIAETRAQIDSVRAKHGIAAGKSSLPDSLARVQSSLPKDLAVLAYFVGDDAGHAWLLTRDKLRTATLPARDVLERGIRAALTEERGNAAGNGAGRVLGKTLFGDLLEGVDARRLLLLADGPLNSVPFAALPAPGHDDLLVERFVIASAPSLELALANPAHAKSRNTRVAVIFDPIYAPDDRRLAFDDAGKVYRGAPAARSTNNLIRLPFSTAEAGAVVKAFGQNNTIQLSGYDATPDRVLALPRDLAVVHFATHAVARSDAPDQSALFLTEYTRERTLLPESRITMNDIARSGLRGDVVVLSGCATGDGRALRGEGVLGLTYGFLANGSHSVVASLWPIEDASTARFMNEFYLAYRESGRAADALRTAQLRTRAIAPSKVWSSFVVRANEFP